MVKKLDVKKVEAALKQAAAAAKTGTKAERAGQLVVTRDSSTGRYVDTTKQAKT